MTSDIQENAMKNLPWYMYPIIAILIPLFIVGMVIAWVIDFVLAFGCKTGFHKWTILSRKPHGYDGMEYVVKKCVRCGEDTVTR